MIEVIGPSDDRVIEHPPVEAARHELRTTHNDLLLNHSITRSLNHPMDQAPSSTKPIAAERRCQLACSRSKYFFPSGVSE